MEKRNTRSRAALLLALALLLAATPALSARSRIWQQHAYEHFAAGTPEGVSIAADGSLRLAPSAEAWASFEAERVWSLVAGPDGALYAGTGDGGKLYRIGKDGQASLLFDSPELALHALVAGPDGALYAGSAPDGLVYRIGKDGRAETLAHTGSHYVWDLAFDAGGLLHAATGEPGKVLSISSGGKVEVLQDLPDRHAMALLFSGPRLYVSTSAGGRVYEIGQGRARLLYEAQQEEMHDLVAGADGALYASALPSIDAGEGPPKPAAVYRIDPQGAVQAIWQEEKAVLVDLVADARGRLLLATAEPERILSLDAQGRPGLLARLEDMVPSRLLALSDGQLLAASAQSGQIRRLGPTPRKRGTLESAVEDFQARSRWGALTWRADVPRGTGLAVQTRSGNSAEPDETWSPWSEEVRQSGAAIASPPARYLQYRAILEGDDRATPVLHALALSGQQANLRPLVTELQIQPYRSQQGGANGAQNQGGPPAVNNRGGRSRPPQAKSLHLVRWQAADPNGDELAYSLYLRGEGQKEWKKVEGNLGQTTVLWDTETMPEGMTQLRLVASDAPDNSVEEALEAERLSAPFAIDNSPPRIELRIVGRQPLVVEALIADRITPLQKAQYTVDYGQEERRIAPVDGIFDSREEKALFTVEGLAPGEHVISLQAWDELDNIGVQQLVVQVE